MLPKFQTSFARQVRIMTPVTLYTFVTAIHYPWVMANLEYFQSTDPSGCSFSNEDLSLITSLLHLGRLMAAIFDICAPITYGRKTHYIVSSFLMLIGTQIFQLYETVLTLSIARLIIGIGIGLGDMATYMYIGETVPKKFRGTFISITIILYYVGIMLTYAAPIFLSYDHILLAVLAISALTFLSCFDLIESPYFLVTNGAPDKALESLTWLNDCTRKQAEDELKVISDNVDKAMSVFDAISNFRKPEMFISCLVVVLLGVVMTLLSSVTTTFANVVFPRAEFVSPRVFAIGFTGLIALASCASTLVVDRYGRRVLLVWGLATQTLAQGVIALLYCLHDEYSIEFPHFAWVMFGLITVTFLLCQFACSVPYSVIRGEIFPTSFKNIAVGFNIVFNSLANAIFLFFFLPIAYSVGLYVNFLIFSVTSASCLLVVWKLLPETKGKSLIEIQMMLQRMSPIRNSTPQRRNVRNLSRPRMSA